MLQPASLTTSGPRRLRALAAGLLTSATLLSAAYAIDVNQVIQMHKLKLPPEAIIASINADTQKKPLSLDDVKKLKKEGVPQAVIDALMPQKSATEPEPEPEPEPEAEATSTVDPSLSDAERLKELQRKVREQKRRAERIEAQLASYEALLAQGKFTEAITSFNQLLPSEQGRETELNPDSDVAYIARAQFGFAEALFGLGLYANAMNRYYELLQTPPDENPVFETAFNRFRECIKMISYDGVPGELGNHYVGKFSQAFQDSYHYLVGRLHYKGESHEEAQLYLEKVTSESPDYARAQYVLGLIAIEDAGNEDEGYDFGKLIKANRFFQSSITLSGEGEERNELSRVIDLSYLALARIAYKLADQIPGSYDAAIYYYRKVPANSTNYIDALYESAWAYFLKGNVRRGMGIFHTLDGPDWQNHYLSDTHLLEAQVFLNNCYTSLAQQAVSRMKRRYLDLRPTLVDYLKVYRDDLYSPVIRRKLKNGLDLPRPLYLSLLSDIRFYDLYSRLAHYSREVQSVEANRGVFGDDLTDLLLVRAKELESGQISVSSDIIYTILEDRLRELERLEEQVTEMEIEIDTQEADKLEEEIRSANQEGQIADEATEAKSQETANLLVGEKYLTWPFEGEFWADEINNYRSYLKSQCKEEE